MKSLFFKWWIGSVTLSLLAFGALADPQPAPRQRLLMDFGWKFHLGNSWGIAQSLAKAGTGRGPASMSFNDATWRTVNLPHDWAVELPFDRNADAGHGFKPVGPDYPHNSEAWYRRTFDLPKEAVGRRLWLEFDGVFRDATVFLNGWFVGHHESGYSSFRYDVTDIANCGGKNVLAVMVDASQFEGWFYEGAGIYRHVWLVETSPLAIGPNGTFVFSEFKNNTPGGPATIHIHTRLDNAGSNEAPATVQCEILDPSGKPVGSTEQSTRVLPGSRYDQMVKQTVRVADPVLWSPESPRLYKLVTTVKSGGRIVDRIETAFGIRTVAFDPERGFLLNGKHYELKGTCNHQDHAGVGTALPDRLQYFRIARLKEMGCNAYRTAHGPPTPELLDACDHLGMLVMDENRLLGSDVIHMDRLRRQIRRDRNHPSVAIWSIGNEEFSVQNTPAGRRVAETMQNLIHQMDPTRPVTYAAPVGNQFAGINQIIQVRGWNYHVGKDMDAYHRAHPAQPNVGTEQGGTACTRGIYATDKQRGYMSAYDDWAPRWAQTAETWWSYFAPRPWLSGGFAWSGFDYRGEPSPYGWPCINSHFGIMDTCGFPKDNFYYYQAWWSDKPMVHLLPHWNWAGKEGQNIDVRAFSNCQEVELFLNGRSLGKKKMKKYSSLKWEVPYRPGTLSAIGLNDGKVVAETKVETTGAPAAVRLEPDRSTINADGRDLSIITVSIRDSRGRVVPTADNLVRFNLQGPGRILGVGNGDPSCHEPDVYVAPWPIHAAGINNWRWHKITTAHRQNLPEVTRQFNDLDWKTYNVRSFSRPLKQDETGVFRAHFEATDRELNAIAASLRFQIINGDGWVYVNGRKAGESHDPRMPASIDVRGLLRAGDNTVAVVVVNHNGAGGVNRGVTLQYETQPRQPQWKRSAFNGLAQIIVQSTKQSGTIHLTAESRGLKLATAAIQTQACELTPAVP